MLQNCAIILLMVIGVKNIVFALPFAFKFSHGFYHFYSTHLNPNMVIMPNVLSFTTGALMLLLAYRLYKRVKMAWVIEMVVLTISIAIQIIKWHTFTVPLIIFEILVWLILLISYKDYSRKSDPITVKWAIICALISLVVVVTNATIGLFLIRSHLKDVHDVIDSFMYTIKLLFLMDPSAVVTTSKIGKIYVESLIWLNWIGIIFSALLILKPLIVKHSHNQKDKEKVRSLVLAYGQNPMSYLALENDKKYFFGNQVEGVVAYTVAANVFVCCGDMICKKEDSETFLNEILAFCNQNDWSILLLNVTDFLKDTYKKAGFGIAKYGEDACFKLDEYTLAGGKIAKVRTAINRANKEGVTVHEYKPTVEYDALLEKELKAVSADWLEGKNMSELCFMLGSLGLEDPMDRRYFYANDASGRPVGLVVFLPFLQKDAYLADVTRYRKDAPVGVLEKIIFDSFMIMKEEGITWGSMGLSPLYNVSDNDKNTITEKLFTFVYENLNNAYGFKQLHFAKEKYAPTQWQSRYIAFSPKPFSPQLAFAIVKAQNPKGISDILLSQLKNLRLGDKHEPKNKSES